jgi:hypothetical protein
VIFLRPEKSDAWFLVLARASRRRREARGMSTRGFETPDYFSSTRRENRSQLGQELAKSRGAQPRFPSLGRRFGRYSCAL